MRSCTLSLVFSVFSSLVYISRSVVVCSSGHSVFFSAEPLLSRWSHRGLVLTSDIKSILIISTLL